MPAKRSSQGAKIVWSKKAYKQLSELPHLVSKRIYEKVSKLKIDLSSLNVKRLIGLPLYRLRVGDYRIIFQLKQKELIILIVKIGHRKEIYKQL